MLSRSFPLLASTLHTCCFFQAKSASEPRSVVAAAKPAESVDVDEEYNSDASGVWHLHMYICTSL